VIIRYLQEGQDLGIEIESFSQEEMIKEIVVSDERYQVIKVYHTDAPSRFMLFIVDIYEQKISDIGYVNTVVKVFKDKIVFVEEIELRKEDRIEKIGEIVREYKFGRAKIRTIPNSKLTPPLTYFYIRGPYRTGIPKIITTTNKTITLGIFDETKIVSEETLWEEYKQIGTKRFELND